MKIMAKSVKNIKSFNIVIEYRIFGLFSLEIMETNKEANRQIQIHARVVCNN